MTVPSAWAEKNMKVGDKLTSDGAPNPRRTATSNRELRKPKISQTLKAFLCHPFRNFTAANGNGAIKNEEGTDRGLFQTLFSDLF